MFFPYCPVKDSTVMLSASSIVELRNTPAGVVVVLRCACREHLTTVHLHEPQPVAA